MLFRKKRTELKNCLCLPEGTSECPTYVYDGRPIARFKRGDKFQMGILKPNINMVSVYSGYRWNGNTGLCIDYKGSAVGYLVGVDYRAFKELNRLFDKVCFTVRHDGIKYGHPVLTGLIPTNDVIEVAKYGIDLTEETHHIHFNISKGWLLGNVDGPVSLSLRYIPPNAGSKAKPHMMLIVDGCDCVELTARNIAYQELSPYVDSDISFCAIETRKSHVNEGVYHHFIVVP